MGRKLPTWLDVLFLAVLSLFASVAVINLFVAILKTRGAGDNVYGAVGYVMGSGLVCWLLYLGIRWLWNDVRKLK